MDDLKNLVARLEIVQDHLFDAGLKPMGATVKEAISALNNSAKLSANSAKGGEAPPKPCACPHKGHPLSNCVFVGWDIKCGETPCYLTRTAT